MSGALLVPSYEVRKTLRCACRAGNAKHEDRFLDCRRLAFDLDEIVHAWILLEANDGTPEIVLPYVSVDLHRDDEAEPVEDAREILGVATDLTVDLLARFVAGIDRRRSLPVNRGVREIARLVAVDA